MRAMLLALLVGCGGPAGIDSRLLPRVQTALATVETDRALAEVDALVREHGADTPIPCDHPGDGVNTISGDPFCHLTHERARSYLRAALTAAGYEVREHETADGKWSAINLSAELPGTHRPDEVVLVSAHYDAFWAAADDNSSSVAITLELARALASQRFARTLRFVFFDLEETGMTGSTRYVRDIAGRENIVGFLNMDCVAYLDLRPGSQRSPPGFPAFGSGDFILGVVGNSDNALVDDLVNLNQALGLTTLLPMSAPGDANYPLTGNLLRSDHAPFWAAGKPGVFLTDTANFRNPNYHMPTDSLGTLSPQLFSGVLHLVAATAVYWADKP